MARQMSTLTIHELPESERPTLYHMVTDQFLVDAYKEIIGLVSDDTDSLPLIASDVESDLLTFQINSPPAHGTLSGTPPNLTYTPSRNFIGSDGSPVFATAATTTARAGGVMVPADETW